MASSTAWGWAAGTAAVLGFFWLTSKPKTTAKSPRNVTAAGPSPLALPSNVTPLSYYSGTVQKTGVPLGQGSKFTEGAQPWGSNGSFLGEDSAPQNVRDLWTKQKKTFEARYMAAFKAHPNDFSPAPDKYSKQLSLVFRPEHTLLTPTPWGWFLTDEFGRPAEGWGFGGGMDVLQIISMVGNTVLPYIPGWGTAANIALQSTIAVAQGKSMEEVALAAARAALPAGAQYAFDLGVGVVLEKKPVDQALVNAAVNELEKKYPGAKLAYEQGKDMAKHYTGKNVNGLTFGGVFS